MYYCGDDQEDEEYTCCSTGKKCSTTASKPAVMPVLPQTYQETENGDQFLLYDSSVGDPQTEIIF